MIREKYKQTYKHTHTYTLTIILTVTEASPGGMVPFVSKASTVNV